MYAPKADATPEDYSVPCGACLCSVLFCVCCVHGVKWRERVALVDELEFKRFRILYNIEKIIDGIWEWNVFLMKTLFGTKVLFGLAYMFYFKKRCLHLKPSPNSGTKKKRLPNITR